MKIKLATLIFGILLFGCSKSNNNIVFTNNLTACPAGITCNYNYFNRADFNGVEQPVSGNYRVFEYYNVNPNMCGATTTLYFKTSLSNGEFVINSSQIAAGQAAGYYVDCPCCDYAEAPPKPIGGEIKGKRTSVNSWLINATVIFGDVINNKPVDTLIVNQYFTLKAL